MFKWSAGDALIEKAHVILAFLTSLPSSLLEVRTIYMVLLPFVKMLWHSRRTEFPSGSHLLLHQVILDHVQGFLKQQQSMRSVVYLK
ncbi:hypothetical protein RHGRI_030551 [Rhododendron griersonianum]|uniref:Uncharacterized protein n=1 Tax=Rhododendron griersonianum TaxID=479676 RepID=A0AAV6INI2_9ERIC|nr:hypothetical protein RHGRI_030551 [Rhododendron griersonianum]